MVSTDGTLSHAGHWGELFPRFILMTPDKGACYPPLLQMRTLGPRKAELLLQGHKTAELGFEPKLQGGPPPHA